MKLATGVKELATAYKLPMALLESVFELSHGDAVTLINKIAGKGVAVSKDELLAQTVLIQHELTELIESVKDDNFLTIRDDIADIKFTAEGMGSRMGMTSTAEDEAEVVASNLTKFDLTPEQAELTKEKYLILGVETFIYIAEIALAEKVYTFYVTISAKDQIDASGKFTPANKWLKSVNFIEPIYRDQSYKYIEPVSVAEEIQSPLSEMRVFVEVTFTGVDTLSIRRDHTMWACEEYIAGEVTNLDTASAFIKNYITNLEVVPFQNDMEIDFDTHYKNMITGLNILLAETSIDNLEIIKPDPYNEGLFYRFQDQFMEVKLSNNGVVNYS